MLKVRQDTMHCHKTVPMPHGKTLKHKIFLYLEKKVVSYHSSKSCKAFSAFTLSFVLQLNYKKSAMQQAFAPKLTFAIETTSNLLLSNR